MKGILYGVGVGPGDPELLTLKAVRVIKACDIIAIPVSSAELTEAVYVSNDEADSFNTYKEMCVSYQIALKEIPEIEHKSILYLPMPMTKDKVLLEETHKKDASFVMKYLEMGKQIAFLTLGDPTIYSTYLYLHKKILKKGYHTQIISGIPSFCAAAARMNIGLVEHAQALHIIPASYPLEDALSFSGTKVLMKMGKKINIVKKRIKESRSKFLMIENCGMEKERVYDNIEEVGENSSYYSIILIKEEED